MWAIKASKRTAFCGMMAALGVVVLLLGSWTGVGAYLCPMLAGLLLLPVGREWGTRYQLLLWLAIGVLCLFLLADLEESLMFLGFFGWYPALRPRLEGLPVFLRWAVKLAVFNAVIIALESLLILVLVPQEMGRGLLVLLLVLGNVTFLIYDRLLPRAEMMYVRRLRPLFFK